VPELPEVETIRQVLIGKRAGEPSLLGQTIIGSSLFWSRTLATPSPDVFKSFVKGRTIVDVNRRGKFLIFILDEGYLIVHLRMSGDLRKASNLGSPRTVEPVLPHDRAYLHFATGWGLAFNDPRKFGRLWLTPDPQQVLKHLGIEPTDPQLTPEEFHQMLHTARRQLKPLLLDQSFLAGIGNIYSDEALFQARLHPRRTSDTLSETDSAELLIAIRHVLELGIQHNGASIDWVYRGGAFQNYFQVYQQTGNPCPNCGTPIERIVISQRGTHICPHCQTLQPEKN